MFNLGVSAQTPLDKQENQISRMAEERHTIAGVILKAFPVHAQLALDGWKGWGRMQWGIDWRRWLLTLILLDPLQPGDQLVRGITLIKL